MALMMNRKWVQIDGGGRMLRLIKIHSPLICEGLKTKNQRFISLTKTGWVTIVVVIFWILYLDRQYICNIFFNEWLILLRCKKWGVDCIFCGGVLSVNAVQDFIGLLMVLTMSVNVSKFLLNWSVHSLSWEQMNYVGSLPGVLKRASIGSFMH